MDSRICLPDLTKNSLYVNVESLSLEDYERVIQAAIGMGAEFFRGRDIFDEVMEDMRERLKDYMFWDKEIYVLIWINDHGILRISASHKVEPGSTVFSFDQFLEYAAERRVVD